jgi:hypothetical protein
VINQQFVLARLGDTAMELFVSGCVYSRLAAALSQPIHDHAGSDQTQANRDWHAGVLYLNSAHRRNVRRLQELDDNDDGEETRTADVFLSGATTPPSAHG